MKKVNLLLSFLFVLGFFSASLANFGGGSNLDDPFAPEILINNDTIPFNERYDDFINNPNSNPFDLADPSIIEQNVEYDPATGMYIISEKIGDDYFRMPSYMTFNEYMDWRAKKEEKEYFRQLSGLSSNTGINGKVDPLSKMDLDKDLINRLFGGTEVDIQPQGNIDLTFGVDFQNIENPILTKRQQKQGGFDFDMNIQLNVQGSIGEKLKLSTNYNTQATFDFDNQLKLEYDADAFSEDEIIKKIEAGNVSLPLRSSLIQGAQSLFGLKTELQFGHLRITAIASQQKSKREAIEIKGGAQVQEFEVTGEQYDENRHFFLSHYHRDHFEEALQNMPTINSLSRITKIEVWVTNDRNETEGIRDIVALADLGEYDRITNDNMFYGQPSTPRNRDVFGIDELPENSSNDIYGDLTQISEARYADKTVGLLTGQFNFQQTRDFEKVRARLLNPSEYTYNAELGFVSVNVNLRADQVLAVSYEYNYAGKDQVYKVGELAEDVPPTEDSITQNVIFTKMLKSTTQRTDLPSWDLMMKNVYSIGAYQVNRDDFRLDIYYDDPGAGLKRFLPETNLVNIPLLRIFNLDNLNVQGDPVPDGVFDFVQNVTINTRNGRIMFPVLEPFGSSLVDQIDGVADKEKFSFQMLYDSTIVRAREFPEFNRFTIKGSYKSAISNEISLGSFNLPQGSVTVTSGAQVLIEGQDYEIDYNIGRIKILNDAILASGSPIKVSFEDNTLFGFQTKTLVGLRADYEVNDNLSVGGTFLNLFERPFTQKVNIGDDPINNKIYGLDFNYSSESAWLTKAVDRIPLIDTKAASKISLVAEMAALRPGHSKAINQVEVDSTGNSSKDKGGSVYIDDFEGSTSSYDLRTPYTAWVPASVPQNDAQNNNPLFPEATEIDSRLSGVNRAGLSWYRIDPSVRDGNDAADNYAAAIPQEEVFRNRQLTPSDNPTIFTFDLAYCPDERGPYNFDEPTGTQYSEGVSNVGGSLKLNSPETRWAGIMRSLNTNDFQAANIEFIEFWMLNPFMDKADGSATSDAGNLYINLGNISEDILRDSRLFFENGLPGATNNSNRPTTNTNLARVPLGPLVTTAFDNNTDNRDLQDVGYDGLNNQGEKELFSDYFNSINAIGVNLDDVSNDDFVTPSDESLTDANFSVADRYAKFNNSQGNARTIGSVSEIIGTNQPDSEDLNNDNTLSETEAYFQYKIPLVPNGDDLDGNTPFITDSIYDVASERTWYRFKIPIDQFTSKVGSIQDFRSIRFIRMYMQGFDEKTILRFARLELVRNQWRRYRRDIVDGNVITSGIPNEALFDVNAVNVEENSSRQPFNYVLPLGIEREQSLGAFPNALQNEQSLAMNVCGLSDGESKAVFKNIKLDLRVYERMRMYVHAEAPDDVEDGDMSIFMRMGSDFEKNYYEYEIPLTFSDSAALPDFSTDNEYKLEVWREENDFDFPLELLKDVKVKRNEAGTAAEIVGKAFAIQDPDNIQNTVRVKGNPNLGNIKGIMIGIRNPKVDVENNTRDICGEVWVNELRVSGFDERGGVAGLARLDIQLADFGNVAASGAFSTIGWGALDQKLADRQRERIQEYAVDVDFELGKFFPDKWGIKIPAFAQFSNIDRIPEYDPYDLDITLEEKLDNQASQADRDSIRNQAFDKTTIKGFNFTNVRKERTNKDKTPMPWDISNFTFTYAQTTTTHSDPIIESDIIDQKRGQVDYTFSRKAKYITPFKKLTKKPKLKKHLGLITGFNFNPIPNTFSFNTIANRQKAETKYRFASNNPYYNTYINKQFVWMRNYDMRWDLTKGLKLDYSASSQSVIDELAEFDDDTQLRRSNAELNAFIKENVRNLGRDKKFQQSVNITYKVPFKSIPVLDWVSTDVKYRGSFNWDAGALNNYNLKDSVHLGNIIQNGQSRSIKGVLNFDKLYNKSKFLKKINKKKSNSRRNSRTSRNKAKASTNDDPKDKKSKKDKKDKEPSKITKTLIRPLLLVRKARFDYTEDFSTVIPGYTPSVDFFGQSTNFTRPGWDFVAGFQPNDAWFEKAVADPSDRWITKSFFLNQEAIRTYTKNYDARLTLEPFTDFKIDVEANYSFTENESLLFKNLDTLYATADPFDRDNYINYGIANQRQIGSYTVSYFAMQTLFQDGFNNMVALFDRYENNRSVISQQLGTGVHTEDGSEYTNGFGEAQREVLIPAFLSAYTDRDPIEFLNSREGDIFKTIPRPNWRLTYNGLSKLPWFKNIFKSVSITHGYKSTLTVNSFETNQQYVNENPFGSQNLNNFGNYYTRFDIPALTITEQFSPLIGIDIKTINDMTFRVDFKKSRNLDADFQTNVLTENRTTEYVAGFGYRLKDVIIPFLTGKKKKKKGSKKSTKKASPGGRGARGANSNVPKGNDLNIKFDFSFRDNITINHYLDQDLAEPTRGTRDISINPSVDYQVNKRLNLRLFFDYRKTVPKTSAAYPITNTAGGITVRFSLN